MPSISQNPLQCLLFFFIFWAHESNNLPCLCHSLSYIKYRHFEAFMSKEEVKVMAASFEVDDDPDEKVCRGVRHMAPLL